MLGIAILTGMSRPVDCHAPTSDIRHVSEHPNLVSAADALAGGAANPGVAKSIEGRPQGDDVAVVDPTGLQAR